MQAKYSPDAVVNTNAISQPRCLAHTDEGISEGEGDDGGAFDLGRLSFLAARCRGTGGIPKPEAVAVGADADHRGADVRLFGDEVGALRDNQGVPALVREPRSEALAHHVEADAKDGRGVPQRSASADLQERGPIVRNRNGIIVLARRGQWDAVDRHEAADGAERASVNGGGREHDPIERTRRGQVKAASVERHDAASLSTASRTAQGASRYIWGNASIASAGAPRRASTDEFEVHTGKAEQCFQHGEDTLQATRLTKDVRTQALEGRDTVGDDSRLNGARIGQYDLQVLHRRSGGRSSVGTAESCTIGVRPGVEDSLNTLLFSDEAGQALRDQARRITKYRDELRLTSASGTSCGEAREREIEDTFYNNNRESYRIIEGRKTDRKAVD